MANGEDTVQMLTLSGKVVQVPKTRVPEALHDGAVPYTAPATPPKPPWAQRYVTQLAGVPEETELNPMKSGMYEGVNDPEEWLARIKEGLKGFRDIFMHPWTGTDEATQAALQRYNYPKSQGAGWGDKALGLAELAGAKLPWIGPSWVKAPEQWVSGDWAGSLGTATGAGLAASAIPEIAKGLARGPVRTAAQYITQIPEGQVEDARQTMWREQDALNSKYLEEKAAIDKYNQNANLENAKAAFDAKQRTIAQEQKVAQLTELHNKSLEQAATLGKQIEKMHNYETEQAKSDFPNVKGTMPAADLLAGLQKIVDAELYGSTTPPPVLKKIMDQLQPPKGATGPVVSTFGDRAPLDLSDPLQLKHYQDLKAQGRLTPEQIQQAEGNFNPDISYSKLQGWATELGNARWGGREPMPRDVGNALEKARRLLIDKRGELAAAEGKFPQHDVAREGWRTLENTFRNTDPDEGSVLAKMLNKQDPVTRNFNPYDILNLLKSERNYNQALEMVSRYDSGVAPTSTLRALRENMAREKALAAEKIPAAKPPVPVEPMEVKQAPQLTWDPVATRRKLLEGKIERGLQTGMWFKAGMIRDFIRNIQHLPSVEDWLTQNPGGPIYTGQPAPGTVSVMRDLAETIDNLKKRAGLSK